MKLYKRIVAFLAVFVYFFSASAQDVTISAEDFVNLNNTNKRLNDSVSALKCLIIEKDSLLNLKTTTYNDLSSQFNGLQLTLDSLRVENQNKDKQIADFNADIPKLQEAADLNAAKLANGRLYFKYSDDLVQPSIISLENLKSEQIKNKFIQALDLLKKYKGYSEDVKDTLNKLQTIDRKEWQSKHQADVYKNKCLSILKQSLYFKDVYTKKNASWSIPYLDNIIDVTKSIISKHNPIDYQFANFMPLIEML